MNKQILINSYNYLTISLAFFPVLGLNITSIMMIVWSFFSLFIAIKTEQKLTKKDIFNIAILSFIFISYTITFLFTEDKQSAKKLIERGIPFLIFPLFFILNKNILNKNILDRVFIVFVISNVFLALYTWGNILNKNFIELFENNNFYNPIFRNIFLEKTNTHLPYLGLLFSFSVFILLIKLYQESSRKTKLLYCFFIIVLIVSELFFAARMALFSLLISIFLFILFKWNYSFQKKIILFFILLISAIFLSKVEPIKSRIDAIYSTEYVLPHKGQSPEEVNIRYGIYNCVEQIFYNNWLFGVGATNVQKELNNCYNQYDYDGNDSYKNIDYNSHNQYFDMLLKYGIIGLVLFIISILWGIRNNNYIYFGFIILFTLSLITENMLSRQLGIVFFTFFNSIFFINKNSIEKNNSY